jgi:hypothetical protein
VPLVAAAVCPCPPLLVPEIATGAAAELDDLRAACDAAVRRLRAARPDGILIMGTGGETAWRRPDEYGTFAPLGLPLDIVPGHRGRPTLPLSLTIGAWLLARNPGGPAASTGPAGPGDSAGSAGAAGAASNGGPGGAGGSGAPGGPTVEVGLASVAATEPPAGCADFGRTQCAPWRPRVALLVVGDGSARRGASSPGYGDPRAEAFDAAVARSLAGADVDGLLALDPLLAADLLATGRPAWQVLAGAAQGADWRGEVLYDAAPYGVSYPVAVWERT